MAHQLRLADLLGGLSMVADLGFGLPAQEAMRSCVAATVFAQRLGLSTERVRDAFYTALLMHIGCVSQSSAGARAFGDEIQLTRTISTVNLSSPTAVAFKAIPEITRGLPPLSRAAVTAFAIARGAAWGRASDRASCEIARETARRLGLPAGTQHALDDIYEWWNGKGAKGIGGDDVALIARVVAVAGDGAYFDDIGDDDLVVQLLRERVGVLDPALVEAFITDREHILGEVNAGDPRQRILDVEPAPVLRRSTAELPAVAAVFGDATDLKTSFLHGHSQRVGTLSQAAAAGLGLDEQTVEQAHIAALLHDIGRVGVSARIWEKRGPLTAAESEQVRMHPYHSERILSGSSALAPVARLAGLHHERCDATGYHRGVSAGDQPVAARVIAAADVFSALVSDRPHRGAMVPDQAAEVLRDEARRGLLDPDAVTAVLGAAGHAAGSTPAARPAGLSAREVEVLRLLAAGLSNAKIAAALHISRRTAEHHVQHIYAKIGVSARTGAAMFGLEHGLLSETVPSPARNR